ncbi:Sporulation related domain-containing protein [Chitinophaga costaii]|uniref:Sporulation related domain-containing protein n=1 Tax=Chitinophaga costaii TaxID=1335309 RepID=A0A1C4BF77_9BACT|nr:SPOR domain-containing protein [Chitinophaga costaii]SCC05358.1 Sporulation related domain-containing protein [Chitinophaga costaii]
MMIKYFAVLGLLLGTTLTAAAQDNTAATTQPAPVITYNTPVVKDARIDAMIRKQIYINTLAIRSQPGFRVQVISTNKRTEANDVKAKVMQQFPQYRTYLDYNPPYFKVRVGDFKSRDEASDLRDKISSALPGSIFVVPTTINLSAEKEGANNEE